MKLGIFERPSVLSLGTRWVHNATITGSRWWQGKTQTNECVLASWLRRSLGKSAFLIWNVVSVRDARHQQSNISSWTVRYYWRRKETKSWITNFVDDACICIGNANATLEEHFASTKQLPDKAKKWGKRWLETLWHFCPAYCLMILFTLIIVGF